MALDTLSTPTSSQPQEADMRGQALARQQQAILLCVLAVFSIAMAFVLSRQPSILKRSDLFARWYATQKMVTEGRSLYDDQNGRELAEIHGRAYNPVIGRFFYPAYLSALIIPIARLPYPAAYMIWLIFIQALMILAIWLTYLEIKWPKNQLLFSAFMFLSVLFIPNLQNIIWAQFNTIAVCALALTYIALRRQRYLLAGLLATGLTFKPQQVLLTLAFLLVWALFRRRRWKFLLGFGVGMAALWLFASLYDPYWVASFVGGVDSYSENIRIQSIIDWLGLPGWIFLIATAAAWAWAVLKHREVAPDSPIFTALVVMSMGIWWLYTPVVGMMHLVVLPIAVALLLASLRKARPRLYPIGAAAFLLLYFLGIAVYLYGLSSPELYGMHVRLSAWVYKLAGPVLLNVLALPLCFDEKMFTV